MRPHLLTFDCYGTLIDWDRGVAGAVRTACPDSASFSDDELLGSFYAIQDDLKTSAYRPYRQLLTEVTLELARRNQWEISEERAGLVPASIPGWTPFDDTNESLVRLTSAGFRLGILSNIDDDLLSGTLEHFDVAFDLLVTAQSLESYKPARAHFDRALEEVGDERSGMLHLAQSLFHDVRPATKLGLDVVWVNRAGEPHPADVEPTAITPDLASAVDWVLDRYGISEGL
jgi:2-haloalkanoic acid dehalogenase type II